MWSDILSVFKEYGQSLPESVMPKPLIKSQSHVLLGHPVNLSEKSYPDFKRHFMHEDKYVYSPVKYFFVFSGSCFSLLLFVFNLQSPRLLV